MPAIPTDTDRNRDPKFSAAVLYAAADDDWIEVLSLIQERVTNGETLPRMETLLTEPPPNKRVAGLLLPIMLVGQEKHN